MQFITTPKKWFIDFNKIYSKNNSKNNIISFHKLSQFDVNFNRYIEKQLIFTEGKSNNLKI